MWKIKSVDTITCITHFNFIITSVTQNRKIIYNMNTKEVEITKNKTTYWYKILTNSR